MIRFNLPLGRFFPSFALTSYRRPLSLVRIQIYPFLSISVYLKGGYKISQDLLFPRDRMHPGKALNVGKRSKNVHYVQ